MKIYFQSMKIVLLHVLGCFVSQVRSFCYPLFAFFLNIYFA